MYFLFNRLDVSLNRFCLIAIFEGYREVIKNSHEHKIKERRSGVLIDEYCLNGCKMWIFIVFFTKPFEGFCVEKKIIWKSMLRKRIFRNY